MRPVWMPESSCSGRVDYCGPMVGGAGPWARWLPGGPELGAGPGAGFSPFMAGPCASRLALRLGCFTAGADLLMGSASADGQGYVPEWLTAQPEGSWDLCQFTGG